MTGTTHFLTIDTVPAHMLGSFLNTDWTGTEKLLGAWSVVFGPVTQLLFLQKAGCGAVQLPNAGLTVSLEGRERQMLQEVNAFKHDPGTLRFLELRTYDVRIGQGERFLDLMMQSLPVRERYSSNLGVWTSMTGRLEQVIHLWGYESLSQRDEVRAALKHDPAWSEYTSTILPMLETLRSTLLTPLPCFLPHFGEE